MTPLLRSPSQLVNPLARQRFLGFGTAAGGGEWTPALLSPMTWFDAASIGVGNGNPIGTWSNQGTLGASGDATATGTARPTLSSTGINGGPAVLFDGVDDLMAFSHSATTAFTIWFIYKANTASGRHRVYDDVGGNRLVGFYDTSRSVFTGSFLYNGSTATSTQVFIAQASSSGRSFRVNGTTVTDATSAGVLTGVAGLGKTTEFIKGNVSELGLMNRILTAGELTSLTRYLTNKSGVSA